MSLRLRVYSNSSLDTTPELRPTVFLVAPYGPVYTASMNVGVCRLSLRLHGVRSLKEKRRISRSLIAQVSNKFNVAIAEVDDNDLWQRLTLGLCCVSNSAPHADETLETVVNFIARQRPDTELIDHEIEIIPSL